MDSVNIVMRYVDNAVDFVQYHESRRSYLVVVLQLGAFNSIYVFHRTPHFDKWRVYQPIRVSSKQNMWPIYKNGTMEAKSISLTLSLILIPYSHGETVEIVEIPIPGLSVVIRVRISPAVMDILDC